MQVAAQSPSISPVPSARSSPILDSTAHHWRAWRMSYGMALLAHITDPRGRSLRIIPDQLSPLRRPAERHLPKRKEKP